MNDSILVDWPTGKISGEDVESSIALLGDLGGIFADRDCWKNMPSNTVVYQVQYWRPVPDGTPGGLFWGNSTIQPGRVGDEYFMTKGHFHRRRDCAEYYATIRGEGCLLLMDEQRKTIVQPMAPGTVHYIPGFTAHRVANTGTVPLVFGACWPSDAGHDYGTIVDLGFSARLVERNGTPTLISSDIGRSE